MPEDRVNTTGTCVRRRELTASQPSLLVNVHDVAALLKCSPRHVWRLVEAGKIPRPYKVGALCRWDRAAIQQWVRDGCPSCRRR